MKNGCFSWDSKVFYWHSVYPHIHDILYDICFFFNTRVYNCIYMIFVAFSEFASWLRRPFKLEIFLFFEMKLCFSMIIWKTSIKLQEFSFADKKNRFHVEMIENMTVFLFQSVIYSIFMCHIDLRVGLFVSCSKYIYISSSMLWGCHLRIAAVKCNLFAGREADIIKCEFAYRSRQLSCIGWRYWRRKNVAYIGNARGAASLGRHKHCCQRDSGLCSSGVMDFQCHCESQFLSS